MSKAVLKPDKQRPKRYMSPANKAKYLKEYGERNNYIWRLVAEDHHVLEDIAEAFDLTRERVRQIANMVNGGPIEGRPSGGSFCDPILAMRAARASGVCSIFACMREIPITSSPSTIKRVLTGIGVWDAVERLWDWRSKSQKRAAKAAYLERYRAAAITLGRTPKVTDMLEGVAGLKGGDMVFAQKHWGSVTAMQKAAGLKANLVGRPPKSLEAVEELRSDLATRYKAAAVILGRNPTHGDFCNGIAGFHSSDSGKVQHLFGTLGGLQERCGLPVISGRRQKIRG